MALTAYCKKCGKEVEAGEVCRICGSRLGKTSAHAVWCVEIVPTRDWMSWNAVMRILLPTGLAALVLILLTEGFSGGTEAVERLLDSGLLTTLAILLGTALAATLAILLMQGRELADFTVDSRGIREIWGKPGGRCRWSGSGKGALPGRMWPGCSCGRKSAWR